MSAPCCSLLLHKPCIFGCQPGKVSKCRYSCGPLGCLQECRCRGAQHELVYVSSVLFYSLSKLAAAQAVCLVGASLANASGCLTSRRHRLPRRRSAYPQSLQCTHEGRGAWDEWGAWKQATSHGQVAWLPLSSAEHTAATAWLQRNCKQATSTTVSNDAKQSWK